MNKKQIGGLVIAVVLFIVTGVTSVFTNVTAERRAADAAEKLLTGGAAFNAPRSDYIAVVSIQGTIQQQTAASLFEAAEGYQHITTLEYIDRLMADGYNKGILLYVDSPGGTIYESDELYEKLAEYKEMTDRPIWNYMSHYAASGGYYISMNSDRIYANRNTVTGSIGVIMSGYDMTGLYEKLGIRYVSITSGVNKDSSKLTDEQIAIYQTQVDEAYDRFVEIVADGRGMTVDDVKKLADGRTYTANQALENGLIDKISSFEDMQAEMSQELRTYNYYEPQSTDSILTSLFSEVKKTVPKSEAQVLTELAEEKENGGLMYYAEQLQ